METNHGSATVSMPKTKRSTQSHHSLAAGLGRLHKTALLVKTTVYALKQALLDAYLCKQLRYLAFAILLRKSYTIKLLGDMYVSHLPENF